MKTLMINVFLLLLIPAFSFANSSETGKITKLITQGGTIGATVISVWLNGTDDTTDCSGGDRWVIQNNKTTGFKEKFTTLLLAYEQNKTITLSHDSNLGCGHQNSRLIYQITLTN